MTDFIHLLDTGSKFRFHQKPETTARGGRHDLISAC